MAIAAFPLLGVKWWLARQSVQCDSWRQQPAYPIPASTAKTSIASMNIQGTGHTHWIDDTPGGDTITALIAFLLALDDNPGK